MAIATVPIGDNRQDGNGVGEFGRSASRKSRTRHVARLDKARKAFALTSTALMILVAFSAISRGASAGNGSPPAPAPIQYGQGYSLTVAPDGKAIFQQTPTFQRWDGAWQPNNSLNVSTGEWPFELADSPTTIGATRLGASFEQAKVPGATYELQPNMIKETLVFLSKPVNLVVRVSFTTSRLTLKLVNKTFVLLDDSGGTLWTASTFRAWDSSDVPQTWEDAISSLDYSNGFIELTLNSDVLGQAVYPLYLDPTWTLSASAGWGSSVFQNLVEDKGDHNLKIGWFADNFNDNTNDQWAVQSGTATFASGVMQLSTSTTVQGGTFGAPWTDLREAFTIRFTASGGVAIAIFRFALVTDYYWLEISEPGDTLTLKKKVGGVTSAIAMVTGVSITTNTDYSVKLVATGNTFEVWWQGVLKANPTDGSPPPSPDSGPIKFSTDSTAKANIDNVRLWNTTSGTITSAVRDAGTTNRPLLERITYVGSAFDWADSQILASTDNVVWSDAHYVKVGPKSALDYAVGEGDQTRYYKVKVELRTTDDNTSSLSDITTTESPPTTPAPSVLLGYERWQYYVGGKVHVVDGNLFLSERDLGLPGKGLPIEFRRSYNSLQTYSGSLGLGWTHNYNVSLSGTTDMTMYDGDGSRLVYTSLGSNLYSSPTGYSATKLIKNGDATYSLFWSDGARWNFTSAGRLSRITDRNGNKLTMTYDGSNRLQKIADDSGQYLELLYDTNNRITTVRDETLRAWTYAYTSNRLTSVTDPRLNSTLYLYDASNRIEKVVDRSNKMTRMAYDASSRVTDLFLGLYNRTTSSVVWQYRWYTISGYANTRSRTVTDANNIASTFTLDERGTPKNITGPLAGSAGMCCGARGSESVESQWDTERNKVVAKDGKGYTARFTYDYREDSLTTLDPTGNVSLSAWDNRDTGTLFVSLLLKSTNFRAYSTTFAYDAKGNLVTMTNAIGASAYRTYDATGFMTTSKDFRGYQTNYTADSHNWLTQVKNPLGYVTKYDHDSLGRLVNATTPLGYRTVTEYDALDRMTKATDPLGNSARYVYNARGDLTKVIDAKGYSTQFDTNVTVGRISKTIEAGGNYSSDAYDTRGNLVAFTNPRGWSTSYLYDGFSRKINETGPGGNYSRWTYDRNGNIATRTDANGNLTSYVYDKLNRVTKVTYPGSVVVTMQYDANGNTLQVAGFGYTRSESFDALDRASSTVDNYGSFSKTLSYQYDADSHRSRMTYADSSYVSYFYDKAGRLTYENSSDGSSWSFGYDNDGRRKTEQYPASPNPIIQTTGYDYASRVTYVATRRGNSNLTNFSYQYDQVGNRVNVTESGGPWTRYIYDNLYRIRNETYSTGRWLSYDYDKDGNRLDRSEKQIGFQNYTLRPTGNGSPIAWSQHPTTGQNFDKVKETVQDGDSTYVTSSTAGNVDSYAVVDLPNVGAATIALVEVDAVARFATSVDCHIDPVCYGHIALMVNGYAGSSLTLSGTYGTFTQTWTKNPATGLAWTLSDIQALQAGVKLIDVGEEARVTQLYVRVQVQNPIVKTVYTYGKDDQLLREEALGLSLTTYTYDKDGNMKTRTSGSGTTTYLYDGENRLLSVTSASATSSFGYSADGRRMKRTTGGTTTYFGNDPMSPSGYDDTVENYTSTGSLDTRYLHGNGIDETLGFKKSSWSSYQTDALGSVTQVTDASGAVTSTYRYDAFGAVRSQTGWNNTYGYAARENEASLGVYYDRARYYDPASGRFLSADPSGTAGGTNRYAYAGNNPAVGKDPSGRMVIWNPGGGGSGGLAGPSTGSQTCNSWQLLHGDCPGDANWGGPGGRSIGGIPTGTPSPAPSSEDYLGRCGLPIALFIVGIIFAVIGLDVNPGLATAIYDMHTAWVVDAAGMLMKGNFFDFIGMIFGIFVTVYWSFIAPTLGWWGAFEVSLGVAKDLTPMGMAIELGMMISGVALGVMSLAADGCL